MTWTGNWNRYPIEEVGMRRKINERGFQFGQFTYKVLDAKFVSSCFNCPSRASPHLSLLFTNNGVKVKTFERVKPG